jgi:hypothetical protein
MGNYVIGVGNYVIVSPSELGNYKIVDTYRDCRDRVSVTRRWAVSTVRPWATWTLPA